MFIVRYLDENNQIKEFLTSVEKDAAEARKQAIEAGIPNNKIMHITSQYDPFEDKEEIFYLYRFRDTIETVVKSSSWETVRENGILKTYLNPSPYYLITEFNRAINGAIIIADSSKFFTSIYRKRKNDLNLYGKQIVSVNPMDENKFLIRFPEEFENETVKNVISILKSYQNFDFVIEIDHPVFINLNQKQVSVQTPNRMIEIESILNIHPK